MGNLFSMDLRKIKISRQKKILTCSPAEFGYVDRKPAALGRTRASQPPECAAAPSYPNYIAGMARINPKQNKTPETKPT